MDENFGDRDVLGVGLLDEICLFVSHVIQSLVTSWIESKEMLSNVGGIGELINLGVAEQVVEYTCLLEIPGAADSLGRIRGRWRAW
jgi:hypothetical protein